MNCVFHVFQLDFVEKKAKNWHDEGAVPSEPFFVARPGATKEDDGEFVFFVIELCTQKIKNKNEMGLNFTMQHCCRCCDLHDQ